jgi:hypothetical protein
VEKPEGFAVTFLDAGSVRSPFLPIAYHKRDKPQKRANSGFGLRHRRETIASCSSLHRVWCNLIFCVNRLEKAPVFRATIKPAHQVRLQTLFDFSVNSA